jgi:hypothetical protein
VKVQGYHEDSVGEFSLTVAEVELGGGGCAGAQLIMLDSLAEGRLSGDSKTYYSVVISTAGRYEIFTTGVSDPIGQLHDAYCVVIAEDDDSGEENNFLIEESLEPGAYYISVGGYDSEARGRYNLLIRESATTAGMEEATPIVIGDSIFATLQRRSEDYYRLEVAEDTYIYIFTTGDTDTRAFLFDSALNELASDDDSGSDGNFRIAQPLEPGIYFIKVLGYSYEESGNYTLHVESGGSR